jgi:hypothetical protein
MTTRRKTYDRFPRNAVAAAVGEMQAVLAAARARLPIAARPAAAAPTRRHFLKASAAGALAAGLPLLSACGGGDDGPSPPPGRELTLFFNYSHLDTAGKAMSIQVGQKSYGLRAMSEAPLVLARERAGNRFLAALDDRFITHFVEGVPAPAPDVVGFQYGVTDLGNGEWTMDSVSLLLPEEPSSTAFGRIREIHGGGATLPLSAKRRKYGLPPAQSARDLYEEQALQDTVSHAATLLTLHKDLMALDGTAAHTIVNGYVMQSIADVDNVEAGISQLGTARPEVQPGVLNPQGWATLRPLRDASGQPRRIQSNDPSDPANGRIVYMPVLPVSMLGAVGTGVQDLLPQVQDDPTLVADVSGRPAGSSLRGTLAVRRDGTATVVQAPKADATSAVALAVQWPTGQKHWLDVQATTAPQSDGSQQITIDYTNIGLRYLGAFIEFYDEGGHLLELGSMPGFSDGTWISAPPTVEYGSASDTRQYIGSIASLGTVMGIPVYTDPTFYGSLSITLQISSNVSRVRLYAGGLGAGSNNYPETIAGGVAGTMIINYLMTMLFGVLGTIPDLDIVFSLAIAGGAELLAAFATGLSDSLSGNNWMTPQFWIDQGMNLLNFIIGIVGGSADPLLKAFAAGIVGVFGAAAAESAIEKAIPIVGLILNAESALAAVADVALTSTAIGMAPFTYVTDLVFTHDLPVSIAHDPGNSVFPRSANLMVVIATFDDGDPYRQDIPLAAPSYPTKIPSVTIANAPYGGQVEIRVEFHQRSLDNTLAGDILLGIGTTGLQNNDDKTNYALTIAEKAYPISSTTQYQHQQRSYLDAGGQHVWVQEGKPTQAPASFGCGSAGQICGFDGITVRQGSSSTATMLGYAWRGQNLSGGGDVGQQALLNADVPSAGYVLSTRAGNAVAGLPIALSRSAGGADNYYVDPTYVDPRAGPKPLIRGITLDGTGAPRFDPTKPNAYAALNLPSDALLLHPSGVLISISGANDRFEVVQPAPTALDDATAATTGLAQVVGGSGSSPGRISQVVAATITQDGTLLLLERGNNRVQAFDFGSNPVRYFKNAPAPYFLPLSEMPTEQGWRHLDIQADFNGLLYVLSTNANNGVYRLSIYDNLAKLQTALSVTEGIFAARIGLDHWRDLYTLNYQPVTIQGSGAAPPITEPSVSLWTPA